MASTRSRLTVAYGIALVATVLLFAFALWIGRGPSVDRALARPREVARSVLTILDEAAGRGALFEAAVVTARDTSTGRRSDTIQVVSRAVRGRLDDVDAYIVLIDRERNPLYRSARVVADTAFLAALPPLRAGRSTFDLLLTQSGPIWAALERYDDSRGLISHVIVGIPLRPLMLGVRELVETLVVIAPFILLISIGGSYLIAGRYALRPVERIIGDLEAITDGRSLHRRLPISDVPDELARFAVTLNAMLSRLETSFDALRRFTADASHELKTPLTVLRADVERAMHPSVPDGERMVALEEALQETARMADLVESLLTLARADEGRFDLYREPVDMEPLVRDVFETAVILGEEAGLTVRLPVVEQATVQGDRIRLRQLFLNLVTNAIKYTPRGGRVELSLSRRLDCVTFTVRDSGIGISAADLPHIFERFYRADRARSRRVRAPDGTWADGGGFGLGLAISDWIARAHGGTLTATSRLGRGSTFVVSLPLGDGALAPQSDPGTGEGTEQPEAAD